ncbi:poly-beta-1,6 N-acetyl-D-glucosamine export porin PgaA [Pseudomonas sp. ADPe]|nr:poly-beta-1,6 N-acetyl-D-glucosamine export porin PgaA [Pseudomonas sp. ADPe]
MLSKTSLSFLASQLLQRRLPMGGCLAVLLLGSAWAQAAEDYDQLVREARAGNYQPALQRLRQTPDDPARLDDHLIIAGWAGLDEEVLQTYQRHSQARLSSGAWASVARAYRNLKRWPQALEAYRRGLAAYPGDQVLLQGQAMTLVDAGRGPEALQKAAALVAAAPRDAERRLALAYVHQQMGEPYAALFQVDQARQLAPQQSRVLSEYVDALQAAGLPRQALAFGERHPGVLSAAQRRSLQADRVAELVRLAEVSPLRDSERFVVADRAIALADQSLAQWAGDPAAAQEVRRVRIDRLGGLYARARMAEVVEEYERLHAEGVQLPPYALRWVAGASLYQRQPERAAELYRQVIASENDKDSDWMDDHQGLFYALVESERLDEVPSLSDGLVAQQPMRLHPPGMGVALPNDDWLEARLLQANGRLYRNDLPAAQQDYESLVESAPDNSRLRTGLASTYLSRGWPRRAEDQLKIAESTDPRGVALETEQGMVARELQEWRQLDLLADDVIQRFPEQLQAQRLDYLRQVHHMAELRISAYGGHANGGEVNGSRDLGFDSVLYSPPIADHWRLFGGAGYATGDFEEGTGHYRWQRVGTEWTGRNTTLEAEVSHNDYGDGDKLGLRLSGVHDIDDQWQYGWSAARLSRETPLRALNSGIRSDRLDGYLRWRQNEQREWRLAYSPSHFSDGNMRHELALTGSQRVYSSPYLVADLGLEVSGSRNSKSEDVPYFNPKSDLLLLPSLNLEHTLYRRYQTRWTQQGQLGAGSYSQQHHGTGAVGLLGYGQRLSLDDRFDAGFNLSAVSRPYDGDRELDYRLVFDLSYRF